MVKPRQNTFHIYRVEILLFLVFGGLLFAWLKLTPPGFLAKIWVIAASVCEQNPAHTLEIGGRLLPLCARCTGTFLGAFVSLCYLSAWGRAERAPKLWKSLILGAFAAAFILDGVNSTLATFFPKYALYIPNNSLRFITGMGMGTAVGVLIWPIWNDTIWSDPQERPLFVHKLAFPGLLLLETAVTAAVLIRIDWLYYPVAVLSSLATPVLITSIYSLLWIVGLKRENRVHCWKELIRFVVLGAICMIVQVGLIDLLRFALLGSWQGIHF
jgi:uncharacterized membrane protein